MPDSNIVHTTMNVGTLSEGEPRRLLPRQAGRVYLLLANWDPAVGVWIHIGASAPTIPVGGGMIYLAPAGGNLERLDAFCPDEAIWAVAEGGDMDRYTCIVGRQARS